MNVSEKQLRTAVNYFVKDMDVYSEKFYTPEKLQEKLINCYEKAGRQLIYYVLILKAALEILPAGYKWMIMGGLGYFICPIDIIPDVIPGVGFADDLAVCTAVISTIKDSMMRNFKEPMRVLIPKEDIKNYLGDLENIKTIDEI